LTYILLNVSLNKNKEFAINSKKIAVIRGKKYAVSTEVQGNRGSAYCGYFGVVLLDKNDIDIGRKIQWLNDFSGIKKTIRIISKMECDSVIIIYRINTEVPVRKNCNYLITPINDINLIEVKSESKEEYDNVTNFVIPQTKVLSEEE